MDNIFFIELIIKSYSNAFDSGSYEYEEETFINNGRSVENLNDYIKSNFRYRFLTELKRIQTLLKETDKVELYSFLVKIKEASYILNNSILAYKEREYQKNKRNNLIGAIDDDKSLFFDLIESFEESYDISLSNIISKAKKDILFNLIDGSFITQTIESFSLDDFENNNVPKLINSNIDNLYLGEETNELGSKLFEFLCNHYMLNKNTSVKYINILYFLKNDVDKKIYIFNLTQEKYKSLILEKTKISISKFSKSENYYDVQKSILDALENTFTKL